MPWRLIGFTAFFAVFLSFIAFNLGNTSNIDFFFLHFEEVPVFLTVFSSFLLGMLVAIPLVYSAKKKKTQDRESGPGGNAKEAKNKSRGKKNKAEAEPDGSEKGPVENPLEKTGGPNAGA